MKRLNYILFIKKIVTRREKLHAATKKHVNIIRLELSILLHDVSHLNDGRHCESENRSHVDHIIIKIQHIIVSHENRDFNHPLKAI